tara:strand:+ start:5011 stop:5136 length:126 start_codon:yes stop_codon:yes gene_type:complete
MRGERERFFVAMGLREEGFVAGLSPLTLINLIMTFLQASVH